MAQTPRNAIVTASYAPDFERCKILCESIDRCVTGHTEHILLVDGPDRDLFRPLEGPKRRILTDTELLPWWLKRLPLAISPGWRRVWVSGLTRPLHGWHVQQLKRIAVAHLLDVDGLLYCDSDTAFVKPFDVSDIWIGDRLRFYRMPNGATQALVDDHRYWVDHAGEAMGIEPADRRDNDYVCQFVTWRRQTVVDMCAHMERLHGRPWISVVGRSRKFSECMLYGAYVDGVLHGEGHHAVSDTLCVARWFDPAPTDAELAALIDGLAPHEVGVGIQSFIAMEPERFRAAVLGHQAAAA